MGIAELTIGPVEGRIRWIDPSFKGGPDMARPARFDPKINPLRGLILWLNIRRLTRWISSNISHTFPGEDAACPTRPERRGHGAEEMDEVEIVSYDPRWPTLFEEEARRLRATLDPALIMGLEHFGSTAIPGLSAKPIIDILIAVRSLADAQASFVEALRNLDYVYWADNPKKDRMFFVKGMPPFGSKRSHHVHVTEAHGEMWQRLAFRDYLRAHPEEAQTYERLKRRLAAEHRADREAYTDAKSAYIESVMRKATK